MTEQASLQILNLIMRRAMEGLKLQLVGRNFFDAIAKIPIQEFRLELWPGYVTSIRQHEQDILICADISTKVMRQETLLDILRNCIRDQRDYKDTYAKMVVGSTVLTDYSNKTYRVDDIEWNSSPATTFATKDGEISYIDYYKTRYNITIKEKSQPLLITRTKERQRRAGLTENIALIPELCRATGLTEDMRTNFRLMKAVAEHTRVGPNQRVQRLLDFNKRLQRTPDSMTTMREWNMSLDQTLVEFTGRELPPEKIVFATREMDGNREADWTKDFRNNSLYTAVPLTNWHCIAPPRGVREATNFVKILQDAVKNMGFQISNPKM